MDNMTQLEAENTQDPVQASQQLIETQDDEEMDYGSPRGTIAFLALMLAGYIIYYVIHYIEIFVLR